MKPFIRLKSYLTVLISLSFIIHSAQVSAETSVNTIHVIDLAGRSIQLEKRPQRLILGESRYIFALSILSPDNPLKYVAGMLSSLNDVDSGSYQSYVKKFPDMDDIPIVGHTSADSFHLEKVLTLGADLAIFGVEGHGPNAHHSDLIAQLERAGVKVVFVDFRQDPLVNTAKSITLLGKILGQEKQAKAYADFYQTELKKVSDGLATLPANTVKPQVFLHSRVGLQDLCCETMVRGMMAAFVEKAGGAIYGKDLVPGSAGVLNLEYVLTHQPDIYVATAIGGPTERQAEGQAPLPFVMTGAGINEAEARASLHNAIAHSGLTELTAIKQQRAYAIWHHFYNSPLNVVAIQAFAKWFYPEHFSTLKPQQTMQTLFNRFQSVPLDGAYWLSLYPAKNIQQAD